MSELKDIEPLGEDWQRELLKEIADLQRRVLELERERDEKLLYQTMLERKGFWGFKYKYSPGELEPLFEAFRQKYGSNPSWWKEPESKAVNNAT